MGRKFFVGGNWKCNGTSDEVKKIVSTLNAAEVPSEEVVEVVVSPPFVFLPLVKGLLRADFSVAAQNCWVRKGGAFTGEISAEMLVNLGIPWVILGHSERRLILKEANEFVGDKVAYALSQGLKVIACVGETLEQRESGSTMEVVAAQTKAIAEKVSNWDHVVIAYEPVWAIGTGKVATPAQAQESVALELLLYQVNLDREVNQIQKMKQMPLVKRRHHGLGPAREKELLSAAPKAHPVRAEPRRIHTDVEQADTCTET